MIVRESTCKADCGVNEYKVGNTGCYFTQKSGIVSIAVCLQLSNSNNKSKSVDIHGFHKSTYCCAVDDESFHISCHGNDNEICLL